MGGHRASGAGDDPVDGPVDLAAVRADDALLDAIAGTGPTGVRSGRHGAGYGFSDGATSVGALDGSVDDERIAAVLAAWKADIEADPMPELVTLDEAVEAVTAGHEAHHRVSGRNRRRMPFAVAAAAAIVALSGVTVAVHGAAPGDTLWGVNKVLFSEHAAQVQKVDDVRRHINDANSAIDRHDYVAARQYLQQADVALPAVPPQEQAPLTAERDKAESSLTPETPTSVTPPGATRPTDVPGRRGPGRSGSPTAPESPRGGDVGQQQQQPPPPPAAGPTRPTSPPDTTTGATEQPTGTPVTPDPRGRSGPPTTTIKPSGMTTRLSPSGSTSTTG